VRLIDGQAPPALLAAAGQNLAAIRRAHAGAKPVLALSFFDGWMIGGIHKFSPISMDQFPAAGLQPEGRESSNATGNNPFPGALVKPALALDFCRVVLISKKVVYNDGGRWQECQQIM
jgi:hypothetical protein